MTGEAAGTETEDAAEPRVSQTGGLKKRAMRGSVVTLLGHFGSNGIRLVSNLILTRLLLPEHFGVMALVNVALIGLHMFSDIGIGPNVIQHERGEEKAFLHTAFSVQALRGVWLMLAGIALAWPIAAFYEIDELTWMVPIAATTAFIDGFTSTKVFRENRRLHLGRVTAIEVASQVASTIAMIVTAVITRSVVSLLIGGIVGAVVRVVLTHVALPGFRDGFAWEPEARHALMTFGRWVFVSTAITFVSMQIDRVVLGKLVDVETLGIYSIAVMLAAVPREVLGQLSQRVLYPVVAELLRTGGQGDAIRTMRRKIMTALVLPVGLIAGEGEAVFDVLYDERYAAGGPMLTILCLGTWLSFMSTTYGVVVLAAAQPKWVSFGTGLKSVVFIGLAYPAYLAGGILGIAGLIAASEIGVVLMVALGAREQKVTTPAFDLGATLAVFAVAGAFHVVQGLLTSATGTQWTGLVVLGVAVLAVSAFAAKRAGLLSRR